MRTFCESLKIHGETTGHLQLQTASELPSLYLTAALLDVRVSHLSKHGGIVEGSWAQK